MFFVNIYYAYVLFCIYSILCRFFLRASARQYLNLTASWLAMHFVNLRGNAMQRSSTRCFDQSIYFDLLFGRDFHQMTNTSWNHQMQVFRWLIQFLLCQLIDLWRKIMIYILRNVPSMKSSQTYPSWKQKLESSQPPFKGWFTLWTCSPLQIWPFEKEGICRTNVPTSKSISPNKTGKEPKAHLS